jgi:hypothetical protein
MKHFTFKRQCIHTDPKQAKKCHATVPLMYTAAEKGDMFKHKAICCDDDRRGMGGHCREDREGKYGEITYRIILQ